MRTPPAAAAKSPHTRRDRADAHTPGRYAPRAVAQAGLPLRAQEEGVPSCAHTRPAQGGPPFTKQVCAKPAKTAVARTWMAKAPTTQVCGPQEKTRGRPVGGGDIPPRGSRDDDAGRPAVGVGPRVDRPLTVRVTPRPTASRAHRRRPTRAGDPTVRRPLTPDRRPGEPLSHERCKKSRGRWWLLLGPGVRPWRRRGLRRLTGRRRRRRGWRLTGRRGRRRGWRSPSEKRATAGTGLG